MKRSIIVLVLLAAVGGGAWYLKRNGTADAANDAAATSAAGRGGAPAGGFPGGFGGAAFGVRPPMTVEVATVKRANLSVSMEVVGNLIGAATVEAVPKVSGRLETVNVRLGDRVTRGQVLAKVEDREILEQVKQAQASFDVSAATIRQREADLRLAQTNLDRTRNLFERQLIPKQTFDDTDARFQAANAQLDLAKAQYAQAQARLDELKINLSNTIITSPVNGFIGRRLLDPGAMVTSNSAFISVVDIGVVRLVANIVEKDLRRITQGMRADVSVDAYPGEQFDGRIAHVAPVLDPATRTAQIEVEVNNAQFRLKPGMYAKVTFTVEHKENALVLPANAIVDIKGEKGVFLPGNGDVAKFQPVTLGMAEDTQVEIASGLAEGARVVSTGATALRDGDKIVLLGAQPGAAGGQRAAGEGGAQRGAGAGRGTPRGGAGRGAPAAGEGAQPTGGQAGPRSGAPPAGGQ